MGWSMLRTVCKGKKRIKRIFFRKLSHFFFLPLPHGNRVSKVIAHYNPKMVVGSPRGKGQAPSNPAAR